MIRKIIHIDMDAFYASVEQRDFPQYRGKPVAVGHFGTRGVVAAASYEARRYGVHSAMPSKTALRKCPHLIFLPARFDVYKAVSQEIMSIFRTYTDRIEPLSLDEAFLDVTENHVNNPSATRIAQQIKQQIKEQTQLTASAGISYNKFLAKIASDYKKPDGIFLIRPEEGERFVEGLAIEHFFGVGKITAQQMHRMGIKNGFDLKQRSETELVSRFGKQGHMFYQNARGIDIRPVVSDWIRKSLGAEITFENDLDTLEMLEPKLREVAQELAVRISKRKFEGKTLTLKVKYANFKTITRSRTYPTAIVSEHELLKQGMTLLTPIDLAPKIRLIGLTVKNSDTDQLYSKQSMQLTINFDNEYL